MVLAIGPAVNEYGLDREAAKESRALAHPVEALF